MVIVWTGKLRMIIKMSSDVDHILRLQKKRAVWMNIAEVVSTLSSCIRGNKGAVLIRDNMIISTGYNGTSRGVLNCDEGGCDRCNDDTIESGKDLDKCICNHAEENSVVQAAYLGVSTKHAEMFCTHKPCLPCVKLLINAGVYRVFYKKEYNVVYPPQLSACIDIVKIVDGVPYEVEI